MTVWRHSVAWNKLKLALDCPRALQYAIDKKPHGSIKTNFYMALGKVVQFAFEQYYNQRINLKPGGQEDKVFPKIIDKVFLSQWFKDLAPTYPYGKSETDLKERATSQILNGVKVMREIGMIDKIVQSEIKLNGTFDGFRMFAMVDFLRQGQSGDYIIDGKGHARQNADPRQVTYYALNRASSGRKIAGGGLLYWDHGYVPVDVTPKALRHFAENEIQAVRSIFHALKDGISGDMEARPEKQKCWDCFWKNVCPDSLHKKAEVINVESSTLSFGDLPPKV